MIGIPPKAVDNIYKIASLLVAIAMTQERCLNSSKSRKQTLSLIARSGAAAIAVTLAGALAGLIGVAGTGIVAVAITRGETGTIAGAIAGASAVAFCAGIVSLIQGDWVKAIGLIVGSMVSFGFAVILFWEMVIKIESPNASLEKGKNQ